MHILIAEDEPIVAEALRARLEGMGHTVVGIACDGCAAVAKAEALSPELIFLDITMPRMTGIQAAERIMATRPVPLILLTAHVHPTLIEQAMTVGVMGYLAKPVDRDDLVPAIALATARFADLIALRSEAQSLKATIFLRQQVERAKGVLTKRIGLSETAALKALHQLARRERCPLVEAAARVIAADELFVTLDRI